MNLLPDLVEYDETEGYRLEQDPTGLLNEGFRYRDPSTGTFLTRDPLGFKAGPNMYTYVRQNPWTHFDPEGLDDKNPPQPPPPPQTQATHTNESSKHPTSSTSKTPSTPDKSAKKTKDAGDTETVNKDGSITMHDKQLQVDTDGMTHKEMTAQGWDDPSHQAKTSWSYDDKGNIQPNKKGTTADASTVPYAVAPENLASTRGGPLGPGSTATITNDKTGKSETLPVMDFSKNRAGEVSAAGVPGLGATITKDKSGAPIPTMGKGDADIPVTVVYHPAAAAKPAPPGKPSTVPKPPAPPKPAPGPKHGEGPKP
jgi:RHS repeat-associated protein